MMHAGKRKGTKMKSIYMALEEKIGRTPTHAELKAEVQRIKTEALIEMANKGKLKFQRRK
jgi:hypothetical protein